MRRISFIICILLLASMVIYPATATRAEDSNGLGLAREPVAVKLAKQEITKAGIGGALPTKFDLRKEKRLTDVRHQGSVGTCWTHAAYASVESNLIGFFSNPEDDDFSEQHMANTNGFDGGRDDGGTIEMSTAYLTRWSGPVPEKLDPYKNDKNASISPKIDPSNIKYRVSDVLYIPSKDYKGIKQALMKYGPVETYIEYEKEYFNTSTNAFYSGDSTNYNHAVAIVGWDDGFSKDKFNAVKGKKPKKNGAFIIRNSWGVNWGEGGYFYVSYEDGNVGVNNGCFIMDTTAKYNKVYQYDILGAVKNFSMESTAIYANVFKSAAEESVQAVGFYTTVPDTDYAIYIKDKIATTDFVSGTPVAKGTIAIPGYHTVKLSTAIPVTQGSKFSVGVVVVVPKGYNASVPMEKVLTGYTSKAVVHPGESYMFANTAWWDMGAQYNANACIKAFTVLNGGTNVIEASEISFSTNVVNMQVGDVTSLGVTILPSNVTNKKTRFLFQKGSGDIIRMDGNSVTALKAGTAELLVTTEDGRHSDKCTIYVSDKPSNQGIKFKDMKLEQAVRSALGVSVGNLDKNTLGKLVSMDASNAGIMSLDGIENLTGLRQLDISGNVITDLGKLAKLSKLEGLAIDNNRGKFELAAIKNLNKLKLLSISADKLSDISPLSGVSSLEQLDISNNQLTNITALGKLSKLNTLSLQGNVGITNLAPLKSAKALSWLNILGTKPSEFNTLSALPKLSKLIYFGDSTYDDLPAKQLISLLKNMDKNNNKAVVLNNKNLEIILRTMLGKNTNDILTTEDLFGITRLDLSQYSMKYTITLTGIDQLVNLQELIAPDLGITNVTPLSKLKKLAYIDLAGNQIMDISPLGTATNLQALYLEDNQIANLSVLTKLPKLEELFLYDNAFTDINPIKSLKNLYALSLGYNKLNDISALAGLTQLRVLELMENNLTSIEPLRGLSKLSILYLSTNPIGDYSPVAGYYNNLVEKDFDLNGGTVEQQKIDEGIYDEYFDYGNGLSDNKDGQQGTDGAATITSIKSVLNTKYHLTEEKLNTLMQLMAGLIDANGYKSSDELVVGMMNVDDYADVGLDELGDYSLDQMGELVDYILQLDRLMN